MRKTSNIKGPRGIGKILLLSELCARVPWECSSLHWQGGVYARSEGGAPPIAKQVTLLALGTLSPLFAGFHVWFLFDLLLPRTVLMVCSGVPFEVKGEKKTPGEPVLSLSLSFLFSQCEPTPNKGFDRQKAHRTWRSIFHPLPL